MTPKPSIRDCGGLRDTTYASGLPPSERPQKKALIVVDVQNDFITGSLAVKDADAIIHPINQLKSSAMFDTVVFSRDSHPVNHISFASRHPGQEPFTSIALATPSLSAINPPSSLTRATRTQDLWPDHCIKGSYGWQFHPNLDTSGADIFIDKGESHDRDSYSAFFKSSDEDKHTILGRQLLERGVTDVYCVGLAFDYCVGATALDAAKEGFKTFVLKDLSKGVMPETCAAMSARLSMAGVTILDD
eukprot:m.64886 g.64886  ORF g.64886 m.64886 type:complete len:246 (+) comp8253_c0_seq1:303-1040(+)